ncbi:toxin-antitoxin system YwqK family antitoxin [Polluticaenibacter yanchengensis]|uniref:Toxin-antitoxin system YwqK family antitoxin n=1 Tax=Polluticaenibacter yanchengensis TaxID=3014562 RepID=A0ABT4UHH4_9BACT|nr:toxin-antitoxin system YwqK family antitoxin [Chitinophagaceae bacterium LY-5]
MMNKFFGIFISFFSLVLTLSAQQPKYTAKQFVSSDDEKQFVRVIPEKDGFMKSYILLTPEIWDVDDDNTTYVVGGKKALVCIEGQVKSGKREGVFSSYILDSIDHTKRYKIWEQTYVNDKLNGEWRTFSLKGNLVDFRTYKNDSLNGVSRNYWIDGKSIMYERIFINGQSKFIQKEYSQNGVVIEETTYVNNIPTGPAKKYYDNGILKDEVNLENGVPNGIRRYYYPSGKIWIEQEMKMGKPWTVIANYTENGQKRNAGTLREGNGTVIFYDNNGSVRETVTYKNGVEF